MHSLLALILLEVMDKEPGIAGFWVGAGVLGAVGFALARRRRWWAIPVLLLLALGFFGAWSERADPFVGPAIAAEAGSSYAIHLIASKVLAAGVILLGMTRRRPAA